MNCLESWGMSCPAQLCLTTRLFPPCASSLASLQHRGRVGLFLLCPGYIRHSFSIPVRASFASLSFLLPLYGLLMLLPVL